LTVPFAFSIGSATLVWCDVIMSILSAGIISAVSVCPRPDSEEQWILTFYGIIYAHERKKITPFLLYGFLTFWDWNEALYALFKRKQWVSTKKQLMLV
jgi:hypothetical protein